MMDEMKLTDLVSLLSGQLIKSVTIDDGDLVIDLDGDELYRVQAAGGTGTIHSGGNLRLVAYRESREYLIGLRGEHE